MTGMSKGIMREITKADIQFVRSPCVWDLGNQILYDMCRVHPRHREDDEIVAKIWLIGRSYSASIERRKNAKGSSEDFYTEKVVAAMKGGRIDSWLGMIQRDGKPGSESSITVHKRLMSLFCSITDLDKRSLASKYLHFHQPNAFFIYDSRACRGIAKAVPSLKQIPELETDEFDPQYRDFVRRCVWLRNEIQKTLGAKLTPRELDKLLLKIADENRHPRTRLARLSKTRN